MNTLRTSLFLSLCLTLSSSNSPVYSAPSAGSSTLKVLTTAVVLCSTFFSPTEGADTSVMERLQGDLHNYQGENSNSLYRETSFKNDDFARTMLEAHDNPFLVNDYTTNHDFQNENEFLAPYMHKNGRKL